ncbi:MAG: protein kinase [Polyangiaceae bacterium]
MSDEGAPESLQSAPVSSPDSGEAIESFRGSFTSFDSEPEAQSLIGSIVAERYRIIKLLGEGGMGAVYLAEHVHMKKPFAVKVLHRELTAISEVVARFEREAVAAGLIDHPNVAKATDFGRLVDGSFFLVLEYVEGQSLSKALERYRPFPQERALIVARQIVDALAAAHAAGIVHRDLKPDNVMLIDRGTGIDSVKVLDFGIAKLDTGKGGPALTQLGTVFGTPQYMAPEQAAGQTVDRRADLYTVGMMLYEMLSGTLPFDGDEIGAILAKQITVVPDPLPAHIDPQLRALVVRQLEKNADDRLQTAEDFLAEIDSILGRLAQNPGSMLHASVPPASASFSLIPPSSVAAHTSAQTVLNHPVGRPLNLVDRVRGMPGVRVPFVVLGAGGLGLLFLGAFLASIVFLAVRPSVDPAAAGGPGGDVDAGTAAATTKVDPDVRVLLASASTGDMNAIKKLEARPADDRSAQEWLALGQGYTANNRTKEGLEAYDRALKLDSKLAKNRSIIGHVRAGANHAETGNLAISIAERHLGSVGADMLYDIWVATKAKNEQTTLAKSLLESPEMKAKFSPALRVAMSLRDARACADYKKLLPEATLHGDTRSTRVLQKLAVKKGCGFLKLGDCYPCLRSGNDLSDALQSVQKRPEPRF